MLDPVDVILIQKFGHSRGPEPEGACGTGG